MKSWPKAGAVRGCKAGKALRIMQGQGWEARGDGLPAPDKNTNRKMSIKESIEKSLGAPATKG